MHPPWGLGRRVTYYNDKPSSEPWLGGRLLWFLGVCLKIQIVLKADAF